MPRPKTHPAIESPHRFKNALATKQPAIERRDLHFVLREESIIPRDDHRHLFSHGLSSPQALNFLAHFHLARTTDASRTGALFRDFVGGPRESLLETYPEALKFANSLDS